jgi:hypothetical protein
MTLDQHIGVRIPGGQPKQINHLPAEYARTEALFRNTEKARFGAKLSWGEADAETVLNDTYSIRLSLGHGFPGRG